MQIIDIKQCDIEPPPQEELEMKILRRDPLWSTAWFPYFGGLRFTSAWRNIGGTWTAVNSETGSLDYGYFLGGSRIHLAIAGGGSTRGTQKVITVRNEGGDVLISTTLAAIANRNADEPHPATIETPGIAGIKCFLRFDDQDSTDADWSWMGVNLSSVVVEV